MAASILIAEDDAAALLLTQRVLDRVLAQIGLDQLRPDAATIAVTTDGEATLQFLHRAAHAKALPNLLLLDWNLPKLHGREVLLALATLEQRQCLKVIVLSSSNIEAEKDEAMALGACDFVHKALSLAEFSQALNQSIRRCFELPF